MIVEATPRLSRFLVAVWRPLTALFVWDCAITIAYYVLPFKAPSLPLTLFGSALALFLGFRDNSAYQRWWEGRILWGAMINASRSFAREVISFLPDAEGRGMQRELILRHIAYVNALRCQLRGLPRDEDTARFLVKGEDDPALQRVNGANGIIDGSAKMLEDAVHNGWIDTIQHTRIESTFVDISNAQGGMERIKNTPLPNQYRFFPTFFTRLFCLLLPIGLVESLGVATPVGSTIAGLMFLAIMTIGDELVDPFANTVHGLPLNAMCRTIEIDLLQAIGDDAPLPVQPIDGVLW